MGWSGDLSRMGQLADRLSELAAVPSAIARRVSATIDGLLEQEFAAGDDPYGDPWAPLAESTVERGRSAPPLTDSGAMRASAHARPLAHAGVGITIDHPAAPHQTGWSGPRGAGPARPILPARGELPESWDDAIAKVARDEFRRRVA